MSTKILPVNKMLVVEREQAPQSKPDQFGFVLPEKVNLSKHIIVTLRAASEGSPFERYIGSKLVVVQGMIDMIMMDMNSFNLVSENGVVGIVAESDFF